MAWLEHDSWPSKVPELILTGTNQDRLVVRGNEIASAAVIFNDASHADARTQLAKAVNGLQLDGLWINAGYADIAPIPEVSPQFFDAMMATNVRGPQL